MPVAVIVPWRGGCAARELAWDQVRSLYATQHPDWPLIVAEPPPGPWIKAAAVMPTALASEADILVIADADVWCEHLADAVDAVTAGWRWAIPHLDVHRLSAEATGRLIAGEALNQLPTVQKPYEGVAGGGIVVISRRTLERVPLDPRFIGWGGEDHAWGYALQTLAGPAWRGSAPLAHLWHPSPARQTRLVGNPDNEQLRRAYNWARASRPRMQQLIDDARRSQPTPAPLPARH